MQTFFITVQEFTHFVQFQPKEDHITDIDAITLSYCWQKMSRFTHFQCVKFSCPKIGSCKFFWQISSLGPCISNGLRFLVKILQRKFVYLKTLQPVEGNVLMCWSPLSLGMKDLWISGKAIGETQGQKNHGIFKIFRISDCLTLDKNSTLIN